MCGEKSYPTLRGHLEGVGDESWCIWPLLVTLHSKHTHLLHIFLNILLDFRFVFQNCHIFLLHLSRQLPLSGTHCLEYPFHYFFFSTLSLSHSVTHLHRSRNARYVASMQARKGRALCMWLKLSCCCGLWYDEKIMPLWDESLQNVFIFSACSYTPVFFLF